MDVCEMDEAGQRMDSMYIDPNQKEDRSNDVKQLKLECQSMWEDELRKIEFLSDPRRGVDPVTAVGSVINISKMLLELYQG